MLERILRDSSRGITLVEEEVGAINRVLSKQIATVARASGMRVCFLTLEEEVSVPAKATSTISSAIGGGEEIATVADLQPLHGATSMAEMLASLEYDLIVINSFSSYFVDKTERETVKLIREVERLSKQGKSFTITYEPGILSDKATAYLRATADNVIIVRTELIGERVSRMLYIPKVAGEDPLDRLIKITVDRFGVQEDTREYVG